jgi:hypothetical protein
MDDIIKDYDYIGIDEGQFFSDVISLLSFIIHSSRLLSMCPNGRMREKECTFRVLTGISKER